MTTLTSAPAGPLGESPLAALMAAVRPEHRGDVLIPEACHPLVDISREKGHLRVVEKNQEIVDNLQRIITACQTRPTTIDQKAADAC